MYGYDYYDYYGYEEAIFEEGAMAFAGVLLLIYGFAMIWGLVSYILHSLGLYTIANRRGIRHPWMAWVPICSDYLLGCVSDHFYHVTENRNKKLRVGILVTAILYVVCLVLFFISYFSFVVEVFASVMSGSYLSDEMVMEMIGPMLGMVGLSLLFSVVAIVMAVMRYVALYGLYASCWPNCKVGFLLLSIFINASTAILVFICRNKDEGMAPVQRPVYPRYTPPAPTPQPEAPAPAPEQPAEEKEPWEN